MSAPVHPQNASGPNGAAQPGEPSRVATTTAQGPDGATFIALEAPTRELVRLAAIIADKDEPALREALASAHRIVPVAWVEEVILQSYIFAGFPRTLNAMREWRRISKVKGPAADPFAEIGSADAWTREGEATCAAVYGRFYERLRHNIVALHPALDAWMIVDGYGKVLSRPGLDLVRRELCIVAVCAVGRQDRQLHSHLHGALHVGATPDQVLGTLHALADLVAPEDLARALHLWSHVAATQAAG